MVELHTLSDLLAELKLLRAEVDRLHQRLDDPDPHCTDTMSDDQIKAAAKDQLRIWELVKVRMREDMIQLHEMDRQMRAGVGLSS